MQRTRTANPLSRLAVAVFATFVLTGASHAQLLDPTPRDMRGPFYPDRLPADQDADLTKVAGREGSARGLPLTLEGRVLDRQGKPLPGIRVEIWQTDDNGRYIHTGDRGDTVRDPDFQGFGATLTDAGGNYRFRTVVPKAYGSRPAHIHARLLRGLREVLVTQVYFPKQTHEPGVSPDWAAMRDRGQTLQVTSPAGAGEISARFDFVFGD
jgi:protocatechuate 3,4-dioxygenase beta subunit